MDIFQKLYNIYNEIYYESDIERNFTDILMKYINICNENNYEFKVFLVANGFC